MVHLFGFSCYSHATNSLLLHQTAAAKAPSPPRPRDWRTVARPLPGQPPRLMVANREQMVSVEGGLGEKASSWRPSTFLSSLPVAIADT